LSVTCVILPMSPNITIPVLGRWLGAVCVCHVITGWSAESHSTSVGECKKSGYFTAYARGGLLLSSDESSLVLDVPVDVHSQDCGAPDCYGHSMTLTLKLHQVGERCEIVSATASASPFNQCEGHFPEPVARPWNNEFAVKGAPDLLDDDLARIELLDAKRREALLLLRDGYYFYEAVDASSKLRPELDPADDDLDPSDPNNCCFGYSSSASRKWPRERE